MTTKFKWTEEVTETLLNSVEGIDVVSADKVAELAETLGTSTRSVAAKLRKLGVVVAKAGDTSTSAWTEDLVATLVDALESNSGKYTYAELATLFADGTFSAKALQGKILSLELYHHVRKADKKVAARSFSEVEEENIVTQANSGAFIEDIAAALGRGVPSIRGKLLSLYREGRITNMPLQSTHVATSKVDVFEGVDVASLTVAELAELTGKTDRGIKSMLSRRGINAADYNGADKRAKNASKE